MPEEKPITDPKQELPIPHDMLLNPEASKSGLISPAASKAESQPIANDTALPMSHWQKLPRKSPLGQYKWLIIIGIIILLTLLAWFASTMFLATSGSNLPTKPPTPSAPPEPTKNPDPMANWQTYTDSTYGFSIHYPEDYQLTATSSGENSKSYVDFCIENKPRTSSCDVTINLFMNTNALSLEEWVTKNQLKLETYEGYASPAAGMFNGLPAYSARNETQMVTFVAQNKYIFQISHGINQEALAIAQTFKLLNETQPSITPDVSVTTPSVINLARKDLAKKLNIAEKDITIAAMNEGMWNDSSLGCPKEGTAYLQVITPGYSVTFMVDNNPYTYHTNKNTAFVECES